MVALRSARTRRGVISEKLPPGLAVLDVRELARRRRRALEERQVRALCRAARGARARRPRERSDRQRLARGGPGAPRDRARGEPARPGARLTFEVNLDQSAGETSTPKKVIEALLAIPPEAQASLSVTREATVLG